MRSREERKAAMGMFWEEAEPLRPKLSGLDFNRDEMPVNSGDQQLDELTITLGTIYYIHELSRLVKEAERAAYDYEAADKLYQTNRANVSYVRHMESQKEYRQQAEAALSYFIKDLGEAAKRGIDYVFAAYGESGTSDETT